MEKKYKLYFILLVVRPSMTETTALGAAMAAGAADGIAVWDLTKLTPLTTDDFSPSILPEGKLFYFLIGIKKILFSIIFFDTFYKIHHANYL